MFKPFVALGPPAPWRVWGVWPNFPIRPRPLACPAHAKLPLALVSACFLGAPAWAQAQTSAPTLAPAETQTPAAPAASGAQNALDAVFVTATRTPEALSDLVADVSVLDRQALERSGASGIADVLSRLPGIEFARYGGVGTATNVYIRGTNANHAAVFIDGVRVDSQSFSGGASWQAIPLDMIDRIEVVRGPSAAVYGSDAIGGVVQLFTRKGQAGVHPFVALGAGSHASYDAAAGVSGAQGAWNYALSAGYERSKGFDTYPGNAFGPNPDKDGFNRRSMQAQLGWALNAQHRLQAQVLSTRLKADYDESLPPIDDYTRHALQTWGLNWHADWSAQYRTVLSVTESSDKAQTYPHYSLADTTVRSYWMQHEWLVGPQRFTAALERRDNTFKNRSQYDGPIDRQSHQTGLALGYGVQSGAHSLQANARLDHDNTFGRKTTGGLAYGLALNAQWRVLASVATAYRVPTLYQRFSSYGSERLQQETSRNGEIGLQYAQGVHRFSVTAYRNRIRNLIVANSANTACLGGAYCNENIGQATIKGLTVAGATTALGIHWQASVDVQSPKNDTNGRELPKRARRYASLSAETQWWGWTVGGEMQTSAARWDDGANTDRLGGYSVFNAYLSKPFARDFTFTARLDNVANKHYALNRGYATEARALHVGIKWAPSLP